jgi:glycosyltransferase involved in cell wall biosynthesis
MRIAFALPGLHRYDRGAEVAFIEVARQLARNGDEVTLFGSGHERAAEPYRFVSSGLVGRETFERFPSLPLFRAETGYEEATYIPGFLKRFRPDQFDVTVTCSFPFINWALRRPIFKGRRPPTVFVTQNGDWPATSDQGEYRYFTCEGLVCTNPDFFQRNHGRWRCALIPNGVDLNRFSPGRDQRKQFGISDDRPVVLMVSALIDSKRVEEGIRAVSLIPGAHLIAVGDGPLRNRISAVAADLLPGRFTRLTAKPQDMPDLYRSADVFLHLSQVESFGNVFVEAMACGTPVVAHDIPRYRWIVGDQEFLTDTAEREHVRDAIVAALAEGRKNEARRSRHVAQFAWPLVAGKYRDFFEEVIAAGLPRARRAPV